MKFRIQAGAEIDVATRDEVREEIAAAGASWMAEIAKGDRFRRFSAYAEPDGSGGLVIGPIGPAEGFVWSVTRMAVYGHSGSGTLGLYLGSGEAGPSAVVIPLLGSYHDLSGNQLVLYSGDTLYVVGTTSASRVWVTGQARELPVSLAWRL